jgi:hypothetical protein
MTVATKSAREPEIKGVSHKLTVHVVTKAGLRVFDASRINYAYPRPSRTRVYQKILLRFSLLILSISKKT